MLICLTEEEQKRFIIADNVGFGEHDFIALSEWDMGLLEDWGVEFPEDTTDSENYSDETENIQVEKQGISKLESSLKLKKKSQDNYWQK